MLELELYSAVRTARCGGAAPVKNERRMRMRILLLCNDFFHPGDIPTNGMSPLNGKGFEIDVISDASGFDPSVLTGYSVVVVSKCDNVSQTDKSGWKTEAVQQAFVDYVENGGGVVFSHSGTVAGENTDLMDRLSGCRFAHHPDQCPVTVSPLKPHPITEGVDTFTEVDEHYHLEILTNDIDVLAACYAPECVLPAAFVRTQGKGRVCVLTPGHNPQVWANPSFQRMLENALRWCGGV